MKAAIDNDVLLKGARYGLLKDLVRAIPSIPPEVGFLGAAPYVLRDLLKRIKPAPDKAVGLALERLFAVAHALEPTPGELDIAAELEQRAQAKGLSLDTGESILCAIALERGASLATGDKRAIVALERLLDELERGEDLEGKVLCLEVLFLRLIKQGNAAAIRSAVCSAPGADRALSNCFSCNGDGENPATWAEGLSSYFAALRREAPRILSV